MLGRQTKLAPESSATVVRRNFCHSCFLCCIRTCFDFIVVTRFTGVGQCRASDGVLNVMAAMKVKWSWKKSPSTGFKNRWYELFNPQGLPYRKKLWHRKSLNHRLLEAALRLCHIIILSRWHLLCATARDRTPGLVWLVWPCLCVAVPRWGYRYLAVASKGFLLL